MTDVVEEQRVVPVEVARGFQRSKELATAVLLDCRLSLSSRSRLLIGRTVGSTTDRVVAHKMQVDVWWVLAEHDPLPFSFVRVCEILGLDPDYIRDAWRAEGLLGDVAAVASGARVVPSPRRVRQRSAGGHMRIGRAA